MWLLAWLPETRVERGLARELNLGAAAEGERPRVEAPLPHVPDHNAAAVAPRQMQQRPAPRREAHRDIAPADGVLAGGLLPVITSNLSAMA